MTNKGRLDAFVQNVYMGIISAASRTVMQPKHATLLGVTNYRVGPHQTDHIVTVKGTDSIGCNFDKFRQLFIIFGANHRDILGD